MEMANFNLEVFDINLFKFVQIESSLIVFWTWKFTTSVNFSQKRRREKKRNKEGLESKIERSCLLIQRLYFRKEKKGIIDQSYSINDSRCCIRKS